MNIIVPAEPNAGISEIADLQRVDHEPWCTAHVYPSPELDKGWCASRTTTHRVEIEVTTDIDALDGATGVEIYAPGDRYLTAQQVREVATAMLKAADQLDPLTRESVIEFCEQIGFDHTADGALEALGFKS